ncbi:MAG: glycosyltransferase family 39 protein [Patescibacteria group bacterium]
MWKRIALGCIIFSFLALSFGSMVNESLTYDEVFYLEEGRRIVSTRTFSDPYNPPLASILTAIPSVFGWKSPTAARLVTIALGVFLILAVYQVGVKALGGTGGLVAAILIAFDPSLLAHSHYITGDVPLTLFIFLAVIAWQKFLIKPDRTRFILVGLSVGYAFATKMTAVPYVGIAFLAIVWWQRSRRGWQWYIARGSGFVGSVIIALVFVWAAYFFTFDVVIKDREDPNRVSVRMLVYAKAHRLPALESTIIFLSQQSLPLGTYAATIKNTVLRAGKPSIVFFDGVIFDRSRWYFLIVNVLRKTPIPFVILVGMGLLSHKKQRFVRSMVACGAGMVLFASFTGMAPLIRYVLPAIPFLALVAAWGARGRKKLLVTILLLWYIAGTVLAYPHFISYANEVVGSRDRRYEVLADSNLDWGQALPDLARYVANRNLGKMRFSYFGRDDGGRYGLASNTAYGSWKFEDICAFHDVVIDPKALTMATIISVSNWYSCRYNKQEAYQKDNIRDVVADVFLVF